MKKYSVRFIYISLFALLLLRCGESIDFPAIGDDVASPVSVTAVNDSHFIVLNSDYDQTYNQGSLLTLDKTGNKVNALATHRLGIDMKVAGNQLFVIFANPEGTGGIAEIFDISDPTAIQSVKTFEVDCNPIGLALSAKYAAVSCNNGKIFAGDLSSVSSASLKLIRNYAFPRRALYINDTYETLLAFPTTELSSTSARDERLVDQKTYTDTETTDVANGVPDANEDSLEERLLVIQYQPWQVAVADLARTKANGFPEPSSDLNNYRDEFFWIDYKLTDESGTPDDEADAETTTKIFRTNFWSVKNNGADSFWISQRFPTNNEASIQSNNVLNVSLTAHPNTATGKNASEFLSYERVYGAQADLPSAPYPGQFATSTIGGNPVILVNHSRDSTNFKESTAYSMSSKQVTTANAFSLSGTEPNFAFYDLALMTDGTVISTSFYGDNLVLLTVPSNLDISGATTTVIK